jgi:hypothetical protein
MGMAFGNEIIEHLKEAPDATDLNKNILKILRSIFDVLEISYHDAAQLEKGNDASGNAKGISYL